jgi:hypothetical protein
VLFDPTNSAGPKINGLAEITELELLRLIIADPKVEFEFT